MAQQSNPNDSPAKSGCKNYIGLFPVAIAFAFLAHLSWRKWPDALIDFGAQLYIPWQLSLGKVLYRDVMYFAGGPLSQYFNALLFKIFGVSFTTLIVANLLLVVLLLVLVYRYFLKISDAFTASTICVAIVCVFAFSQYLPIGNYNYIAPYAHETLHGLVISIIGLSLFANWLQKKNRTQIATAGVCYGAVFLTKPDIFTALSIASATAFFLFYVQTRSIRLLLKSLAGFALGAIISPALAFLFFRAVENNSGALRSVVWAWIPLLTTSAAKNEFYQSGMGFDDLVPNLVLSATQFFGYCCVIVLCAWASRRWSSEQPRTRFLPLLIFGGLIVAAFFHKWLESARALLLMAPTIFATQFWFWKKSAEKSERLAPAILWSAFAWAMLAKMGVHCRIWHYGFYLAMPATAAAIYFVLFFVPEQLRSRQISPLVFRLVIVSLLAIGTIQLTSISAKIYEAKTSTLGPGDDRIYSWRPNEDPTAAAMSDALNWIQINCPTNATLAAFPEGVMLNYLSRRSNPTPYNFILPVWQDQFGEEIILSAYKKSPPDFVALIQRDTSEFGFDYFGQTEAYGMKTMQWIQQNYSAVHLIGHEPLQNGAFGIKIFKRKSPN